MNTNTIEKHSPGPWKIQDLGERTGYPNWRSFAIRTEKENVHLATVGNIDRYFEGKELANATLMAAAPELAEACKVALDNLKGIPVEEFKSSDMLARVACAIRTLSQASQKAGAL